MSILSTIAGWFGRRGGEGEPLLVDVDAARFVYVMIPEDIEPLDRGDKYEDPIEERLAQAGLGEITGGGSQLGPARPDGSTSVEFCGVDVEVTAGAEVEAALTLLRELLPALGAPEGTELHYTRAGARLLDAWAGGRWACGRPRAMVHPGFGV